MKRIVIRALFIPAVACLLLMAFAPLPEAKAGASRTEVIRFMDSAKRRIELQTPVNRVVVVYSQLLLAMKAIGVEDDKVVGLDEFTVDQYKNILGAAKNKRVIGKNLFNLDIEKIIEIGTQVLIVTPGALRQMPNLESQLGKSGIHVICLDFDLKNVKEVLTVLGQMFGKQAKAEGFSKFWFSSLDLIGGRIQRIPDKDRVRVYWENTNTPYTTINKSSHGHEILELAGGYNIARDLAGVKADPEWVITQNPDVIIKYPMGSIHQGGFGQTDVRPFQAMREEIIRRLGFSQITAVKKGHVYIVWQLIKTGLFENIAISYLAKILYPNLFKDLVPENHFRIMVEK